MLCTLHMKFKNKSTRDNRSSKLLPLFCFINDISNCFLAPLTGVVAIEELEITHPPRDVYALKDAPLTLDCATSGQPIITVIWQRNGQEINLDGSRSMLANGSLLIDSILPRKDAGIYQCCASNEYGTICSANVTVTIAGKL